MFAGSAVVKARELIERGELVHLGSQGFDLCKTVDLVGDLVTHTGNLKLLVNQVHAKNQDQANERTHSLIEEKAVCPLLR